MFLQKKSIVANGIKGKLVKQSIFFVFYIASLLPTDSHSPVSLRPPTELEASNLFPCSKSPVFQHQTKVHQSQSLSLFFFGGVQFFPLFVCVFTLMIDHRVDSQVWNYSYRAVICFKFDWSFQWFSSLEQNSYRTNRMIDFLSSCMEQIREGKLHKLSATRIIPETRKSCKKKKEKKAAYIEFYVSYILWNILLQLMYMPICD